MPEAQIHSPSSNLNITGHSLQAQRNSNTESKYLNHLIIIRNNLYIYSFKWINVVASIAMNMCINEYSVAVRLVNYSEITRGYVALGWFLTGPSQKIQVSMIFLISTYDSFNTVKIQRAQQLEVTLVFTSQMVLAIMFTLLSDSQ